MTLLAPTPEIHETIRKALEAMKEVVRMTRIAPGVLTAEMRNMKTLRELAFMQLARTHYGANQPGYANFYYQKIERGGPQWLEALGCTTRYSGTDTTMGLAMAGTGWLFPFFSPLIGWLGVAKP